MFCFYQLGREVLNEAVRVIEVGVTTDEIDRIVHEVSFQAAKMYFFKLLFLVCLHENYIF